MTYIFGTVGSAILLRHNPDRKLLGHRSGRGLQGLLRSWSVGAVAMGGAGSAWHRFELRAFRVAEGGRAVGMTAAPAEVACHSAHVLFVIQRIPALATARRVMDATADTVLMENDIVAVAGPRDVLVDVLGKAAQEVEDPELLHVPVEGVDAYVTNKAVDGKTLAELASLPSARGVFLRQIVRGAVATSIPILPDTKVHRGDYSDHCWPRAGYRQRR